MATVVTTTTSAVARPAAEGAVSGLSLGDYLGVAGLLIAIGGILVASQTRRVRHLERRLDELDGRFEAAGAILSAWAQLVVFEQRVVSAIQGVTEWNTGMIDRLWADRASADGRIEAMRIAKRLSMSVERSTQELSLFSPDAGIRATAARQLAGGLGSLESLSGFESAIAIWPDDPYLRSARERLFQRLAMPPTNQ